MTSFKEHLLESFHRQVTFSHDYSPLYAALYSCTASWLSAESADNDPLVQWLLETGKDRQILDVTLLLAAGLHKDVLSGAAETAALAEYYPSAGGSRRPDSGFEPALREAIIGRKESLAAFIQSANVQTNETARGLCWLLPVRAMGWEKICLVDLGASAGLNLAANKRAYGLEDETSGEVLLKIGEAPSAQFITQCRGPLSFLSRFKRMAMPEIAGRLGCDMLPFSLDTAEQELTLMSYIWPDQVARLERLQEGIAVFREVQTGPAPIQLFPVNLPEGLGDFLQNAVSMNETPVVIYNTFITIYLSDKGDSFKKTIGRWAADRQQPVLWLQWEPMHDLEGGPEYGWCGWTADLWQAGEHTRWFLAWVHPHGTHIQLEPDFANFP
jgi:hypothetical protein